MNRQPSGVEDYDTNSPRIIYEQNGEQKELVCDFVAGCDGFHGVARKSVPADKHINLRTDLSLRLAGHSL